MPTFHSPQTSSSAPLPAVTTHGGSTPAPLLSTGPIRLPTAGKIRAGIKVLTASAAAEPRACEIYEQGLREGQSFDRIEQAIVQALPRLTNPLRPRNVAWFTVRPQDFANPELAHQLLKAFGEDRGEGRKLYRLPVVFPSDQWQVVMPHELAAWGTHDKRFWSEYSPDGRTRWCMRHAPVPVDTQGRRTLRPFGGRKTVPRDDNGGLCDPEACPEYQRGDCNLSGRFVFFIPGIRTLSAFELHTSSFYGMKAAIRTFEAVAFLRGGRISGFLDGRGTPFYLSKRLMEVSHIDERGRAVRVPQWIIDLEAPVDVSTLLRDSSDEGVLTEAEAARVAIERAARTGGEAAPQPVPRDGGVGAARGAAIADGEPSLGKVLARAVAMGIEDARFQSYADRRWGMGWRLNVRGRRRVRDELERHANDPEGYADKITAALREAS